MLLSLLFSILSQFFIDDGTKSGQRSIFQRSAVDKYRRCSPHTRIDPFFHILIDFGPYQRVLHFVFEGLLIQRQRSGYLSNLLVIELVVVFEKKIMKFPEFSLGLGGQCCRGGLPGEFVVSKGEVFENELYVIRILLKHLLE